MPKSPSRKTQLPAAAREALMETLKDRFERFPKRHSGLAWDDVQARIEARPEKLSSLSEMEATGGEPDVVGLDKATGEYLFVDCSADSPGGRTSLCYDRDALDARKENKPKGNVVDRVEEMGVELLTEEQYRDLQKLGPFDAKSSSWVKTPEAVRKLGGALYCDYRYGRVFVYHNGAQSYYSGRGFRALLRV